MSAEVQTVFLRLDDSTSLDEVRLKQLLASVREALTTVGIDVLTEEAKKNQTDGTMLVRFESVATSFGAIFATMRDREGNFLWQEHAGCRAPEADAWGAIFDDVSARLVGKLPSRHKAAREPSASSHPAAR